MLESALMAKQFRPVVRDSSYFERLGMQVELERLQKQAAEIRDRLQRYPARILKRLNIAGLAQAQDGNEGDTSGTIHHRSGKRTRSAETRRRMSAAQRARWAKRRGGSPGGQSPAPGATERDRAAGRKAGVAATVERARRSARGSATTGDTRKRTMSPEARRRIGEAQRRRWAELKRQRR
jgi:hypothetical protein